MSQNDQRLASYLNHILEAIERINRYTANLEKSTFLKAGLVQDAVVRNLEVIGEASHNILLHDPAFSDAHPELPLVSAYQMRNVVAHGYFAVDYEIVWETIQTELPRLNQQVRSALGRLDNQD